MSIASDPVLISVGSHHISTEYGGGGPASKEELYPVCTAVWRGKVYHVSLSADRYVHSSGWSDWRIYARALRPPGSETARHAMQDVCVPLVRDWLHSDAYRASRATAFKHLISQIIREDTYGEAQRSTDALQRHGHELTAHDRGRLQRAAELRRELNAILA